MKKTLSFLFVFLYLHVGSARALLISDIDDTIKISHVLDRSEALRNLFKVDNLFAGMSKLYSALANENPDIQFVYLSNAPEFLMEDFHKHFLAENGFPAGDLFLNSNSLDSNFKYNKIVELIENYQPQELILIGDNGERDIFIYRQVAVDYPGIRVKTFIHTVYNSASGDSESHGQKLAEDQIPFVSSVDLSDEFAQMALLSKLAYSQMVSHVWRQIESADPQAEDGELAFPYWLKCSDYLKLKDVDQMAARTTLPDLQAYYRFLKLRCK